MVTYIFRRLVTAALILLGASYLVYLLTAASGDPLEEFRANPTPQKQQLMDARTELLQLDTPAPLRYFKWFGGAVQCLVPFANSCDLGKNIAGQPITDALGFALVQTLTLVTAATVLAILIGITLGIVTALRQYSTLDYGVTFMAFLFFSLPIFWVAVLLKEFGAIGFNDFLRNPDVPLPAALGIGVVVGAADSRRGGRRPCGAGCWPAPSPSPFATAVLIYFSATEWFKTPGLGPVVIAIAGVGIAFAVTLLSAGLKNRKALQSALIAVGVGVVLYFVLQPLLNEATFLMIVLLAVAVVLIGLGIGYLMGGYDRGQSMRAAAHHLVPGRLPDPAGPLHAGVAQLLQQQPGARPADRHHRRQHAEHRGRLLGPEPGLLHPPDPADHGADPDFAGQLHPLHPGLDAGNHEHGLHPHRPGQGPVGADRRHAPRLPQRADPDRHDRRLRHRRR